MTSDREGSEPDELEGTPYTRVVGVRPLGRGAMGVVYAARHRFLDTPVVVKVLRADIDGAPGLARRMQVEAQALAHLKSPHIPTCSDFGFTHDGFPYLVTERLHGETLHDRLGGAQSPGRGPMASAEALAIVRQLLLALHVAHRAGIVHRDIKPSNIFLCNDGPVRPFVKLIDFGVVKVLSDAGGIAAGSKTGTGIFVGTPRWAAPEQVTARPLDGRADLYAATLVLYRLLAGRGAFDHHRGQGDLLLAQALEVPVAPSTFEPSIDAELDQVILRGLEKEPDRRFASALDLLHALPEPGACAPIRPSPPRMAAAGPARTAADDPTRLGEILDETLSLPALAPPAGDVGREP